jgi:hypothetical protein
MMDRIKIIGLMYDSGITVLERKELTQAGVFEVVEYPIQGDLTNFWQFVDIYTEKLMEELNGKPT